MNRNRKVAIFLAIFLLSISLIFLIKNYKIKTERSQKNTTETVEESQHPMTQSVEQTQLPSPNKKGDTSVEEAIQNRRSVRTFKPDPLNLQELSQLLWAAQGITNPITGYRAAPSAGALYPLELYIAVSSNGVQNLKAGVYHYIPKTHTLEKKTEQISIRDLATAALSQHFIAEAPTSLIITAKYERVTDKYGERGKRYVHMEAGHTAENIYLQAQTLNLGTVTVGAFKDEEVINLLQIPESHKPLYIMPIGHPK